MTHPALRNASWIYGIKKNRHQRKVFCPILDWEPLLTFYGQPTILERGGYMAWPNPLYEKSWGSPSRWRSLSFTSLDQCCILWPHGRLLPHSKLRLAPGTPLQPGVHGDTRAVQAAQPLSSMPTASCHNTPPFNTAGHLVSSQHCSRHSYNS